MKRTILLTALGMFAVAAPPQVLGQPALDSRWADLASPDEAMATRALLALTATPKETTAYLKEHLKPVKADAKRVAQLVKQLDSSNFALRNRAMNELEYYGKYIKADLETALKADPSAEAKSRVQELIAKMPKEKKDEAAPPPPLKGRSVSVQNINGQIRIIIDGQVFDPSKAATPPPPPPGPPAGWVRAVRAVTLLEHLATPEARAQLQAIADGAPDALPTVAARAALERLKKGQ
ncbi:MAG TPA: hypothetical protein VFE62_05250 [Gemmataceae bacterium]|nr:hypothetical protein [Gemmataceae bacterium]